jgi:glycosyltransferase involved in cell wall biosynthesis
VTDTQERILNAVTQAFDAGDVTATAQSLVQQTLQHWEWTVAVEPGVDDPRINPGAPASEPPYAAVIDAGVELAPTALEHSVWYLETHPRLDAAHDEGVIVFRSEFRDAVRGSDVDGVVRRLEAAGATIVSDVAGQGALASEVALAARLSHRPVAWIPEQLPFRNRLPGTENRLLLFIPWMEVGGADRFNLDLLESCLAAGWSITVVATLASQQPWRERFESFTGDIVVLPDLIPLVDQPRFLHYLLDSRRPDVVLVSNSELAYRFLPYLRSVAPDATFVDYCHSDSPTWNSGGYPRLSVQYHGQLDMTLTASEQLRGWMIQRGSDPDRVKVAYVGVDVDRFSPDPVARQSVRDALGLGDTPTVLFVGRVDEDKQPDVLVEALRLLAADGVDFNAVVAGGGPAFGILRSLIRSRGLRSRTRLLGAVEPEYVVDLMRAADVLVLPSRWEGIALTLYEAMACGLPVVATDVGGHRELVTSEVGTLVRRATAAEEARDCAVALAAILRDAEARERMGRAARLRAVEVFPRTATTKQLFGGLEEARQLHDSAPRALLPHDAALATVTDAVELFRIHAELTQPARFAPSGHLTDSMRMALLAAAQRRLGGVYRWSSAHGLGFVVPAKEAVVRILLPRARG